MFTDAERIKRLHGFFADTADRACRLSECPVPKGAVLARGSKVLSYGINRRLSEWETSAIYDAIFSAHDKDLTGTAIFSTCFPSLDDMKLIVATGISSIYYLGEVTDMDAARLVNSLNEKSISLEITRLNRIDG